MLKQENKKSEKYYYENKAKLILIKLFTDTYSEDIKHNDKPDLYDDTNSIGIEVTRAFISPIFPEQQSLWKNKKILRVNEKGKAEYKRNHISYACIENKILVQMFWVSTKYLLDSFTAKLNKLNADIYDELKHYDLFIYSQEINDKEDMPPLLDKMIMLQANTNYQYRMVYILDRDIIYCYNLFTKTFSTKQIDSNILNDINNQAIIEK